MKIPAVNVIKKEGDSFMLDKNFEQILQSIESGVPVIIRELFSSEEVTHLRKNLFKWQTTKFQRMI